MRQRLTWLSTAPLMLAGLLAAHALGYRLAISDPHARADALAHSGHGYFSYVPFALTVCLGVLLAGLALQALSALPRRAAPARDIAADRALAAGRIRGAGAHRAIPPYGPGSVDDRDPARVPGRPGASAPLCPRGAAPGLGARFRSPSRRTRVGLRAATHFPCFRPYPRPRLGRSAPVRARARVRRARTATPSPTVVPSSEGVS